MNNNNNNNNIGKQKDFHYSHSGLETEKIATECLDDIRLWLKKTYGDADWQVVDSISQDRFGWKVSLDARYRPEFYAND